MGSPAKGHEGTSWRLLQACYGSQLAPNLVSGSPSAGFCIILTFLCHSLRPPYFPAQEDVPGSSCSLSASVLEPVNSLRFLLVEGDLEIELRVLGALIAIRGKL